jgi:hypothetical protein
MSHATPKVQRIPRASRAIAPSCATNDSNGSGPATVNSPRLTAKSLSATGATARQSAYRLWRAAASRNPKL